ncbi:MAG: Na+/H+-dicarboxylate symporter, partial [uncultured Actinomycetospora sp.]
VDAGSGRAARTEVRRVGPQGGVDPAVVLGGGGHHGRRRGRPRGPRLRLGPQVPARHLHPAHQDDHRTGHLLHRDRRHRLDRQPRRRGRHRGARAGVLPADDAAGPRARADRGQHRPAGCGLPADPARPRDARRGAGRRRQRRRRGRRDRVHHEHAAARQLRRPVRRERDPARARAGHPRGRGDVDARAGAAQARGRRHRPLRQGHLRHDPPDHVPRAPRGVRRDRLHRRRPRRREPRQPRRADGHLLGHVRAVRGRDPRWGLRVLRVQHLQADPDDQGRDPHHRRHVLVGDGAAAPAGQARVGRGVALDGQHGAAHRVLVQPRRHVHLPDHGRAVHRPGRRAGPALGRPDRPRRADAADVQGRGGRLRRGPGHPRGLAAGVRRRLLHHRVDRHRHRDHRRHRPHHERGSRADQRHRQHRRRHGDLGVERRPRRRAFPGRARRSGPRPRRHRAGVRGRRRDRRGRRRPHHRRAHPRGRGLERL